MNKHPSYHILKKKTKNSLGRANRQCSVGDHFVLESGTKDSIAEGLVIGSEAFHSHLFQSNPRPKATENCVPSIWFSSLVDLITKQARLQYKLKIYKFKISK